MDFFMFILGIGYHYFRENVEFAMLGVFWLASMGQCFSFLATQDCLPLPVYHSILVPVRY